MPNKSREASLAEALLSVAKWAADSYSMWRGVKQGTDPILPISTRTTQFLFPLLSYGEYIVETERLWCVCVQGAPGELTVAEVTAFFGHLRK